MAEQKSSKNLTSPVFRVSFPNIFSKNDMSGKYQLDMIFEDDADLSEMKMVANKAAKEYFGDDLPKNMRSPFRSGDEKVDNKTGETYKGYAECVCFVTARSERRPGVVDSKVQTIEDEEDFYGGCYARATLSCYAYGGKKTGFKPGVAFGLQNLQKVKDGESFGGNKSQAKNDFDAFGSSEDNPASYIPDSDDIPF